MKIHVLFLFTLFLIGCSTAPEKKKAITQEDVAGNWLCTIPASDNYSKDKKVNLYVKNGVCHFGDFQDNRTSYSIKKNLLIVKDHLGHVYQAKIVESGKDRLKLKLLSKWRNAFQHSDSKIASTITFYRMKVRNNLGVKSVKFVNRSSYSLATPVYAFQFSSNGDFLFEGVAKVKNFGFFTGKTDERFMTILLEKLRYIDIAKMKGRIGSTAEDADWVELEVSTSRGVFSCYFSAHDNTPVQYINLMEYVHSNYEQFKLTPLDQTDFLKSGGTPQERMMEKVLNFIPC